MLFVLLLITHAVHHLISSRCTLVGASRKERGTCVFTRGCACHARACNLFACVVRASCMHRAYYEQEFTVVLSNEYHMYNLFETSRVGSIRKCSIIFHDVGTWNLEITYIDYWSPFLNIYYVVYCYLTTGM